MRYIAPVLVALTAIAGCGSSNEPLQSDASTNGTSGPIRLAPPVLLGDTDGPCTEAHTVCMTVQMPATMPGAPTHLAVGYYKAVPVKAPAAARGVLQAPQLEAGQTFRLKAEDGNLTGAYYPVVLLYMPGGGDIIAVDDLDYTAEATKTVDFTSAPINVDETLLLVFGI